MVGSVGGLGSPFSIFSYISSVDLESLDCAACHRKFSRQYPEPMLSFIILVISLLSIVSNTNCELCAEIGGIKHVDTIQLRSPEHLDRRIGLIQSGKPNAALWEWLVFPQGRVSMDI